MIILSFVLSILVSYFLGGLNTAIIVTKIKSGEDIRKLGSGNAGLTNTYRTQGKLAALFVLIGDILKGVFAVLATRLIFAYVGGVNALDVSTGFYFVGYMSTLCATLGHVFPPLYGFKGGKGVLVTAGAMLAAEPLLSLILITVFIVLTLATKYVSIASCTVAILYPITALLFSIWHNDPSMPYNIIFSGIACALMLFMHRANIKRLLNGTENKFKFKK